MCEQCQCQLISIRYVTVFTVVDVCFSLSPSPLSVYVVSVIVVVLFCPRDQILLYCL